MKFLIVGLGNIGPDYQGTRHNVGFEILDCYAKQSSIFFTPGRYGDIAESKYKGRNLILLKPSTFMNLSGKAVSYWMQKEKIPLERVLIITDDLALPFGKIRLRAKGSDGGHNGLKSIIEVLGEAAFPRIRFGIGSEFQKGRQVNYVLDKWSEEENETLDERVKLASEFINSYVFHGVQRTMSDFNKR